MVRKGMTFHTDTLPVQIVEKTLWVAYACHGIGLFIRELPQRSRLCWVGQIDGGRHERWIDRKCLKGVIEFYALISVITMLSEGPVPE